MQRRFYQSGDDGAIALTLRPQLSAKATAISSAKFGQANAAALSAKATAQSSMMSAATGQLALSAMVTAISQIAANLSTGANLVALRASITAMSSMTTEEFTQAVALSSLLTASSGMPNGLTGIVPLGLYVVANSSIAAGFSSVALALGQSITAAVQTVQNLSLTAPLAMMTAAQAQIANALAGKISLPFRTSIQGKIKPVLGGMAAMSLRTRANVSAVFDMDLTTQLRAIYYVCQAKARAGMKGTLTLSTNIEGQVKGKSFLRVASQLFARMTAMAKFGAVTIPQGGPAMADLDQGGNVFRGARVYRGPSLGWQQVDVSPEIYVNLSPANIGSGVSIVLVNFAGPCAITLPDVASWLQAERDNGVRQPFDNYLLIKDYFGNAGASPITLFPATGQTIDGLPSFQILANYASCKLRPLSNLTGWYVE